jgi:hypothetical protein
METYNRIIKMNDIKEIFVIYDTYTNGYYDGRGFSGILFAKKYHIRENAVTEVSNIITHSNGVQMLEIKKLYTN